MSKLGDFLIEKQVVGLEQLAEAEAVAKKGELGVSEALAQLGYASSEQIMQAQADIHGYEF